MARRMRYKAKFRGWGNMNIMGIVFGLVVIIATLWGGGIAVNALGTTMTCTESPFYEGLSLIGWTVTDNVNSSGATPLINGVQGACNEQVASYGTTFDNTTLHNNVITDTSGAGLLAIVGIFGMLSILGSIFRVSRQ